MTPLLSRGVTLSLWVEVLNDTVPRVVKTGVFDVVNANTSSTTRLSMSCHIERIEVQRKHGV